jgi:DinB superfamily
MDTTSLRLAYAGLLEAGQQLASAGAAAPPPGEWDAAQLLAHLVSVDAAVLAAAYTVVAGGHGTFDNRQSLDPWNLERISNRAGDEAHLRGRIRLQGEALCALAEQLSEEELAQPIPTLLLSGTTVRVDGPVRLGDLVAGLADDHLPQHTRQLLALLPLSTTSERGCGA